MRPPGRALSRHASAYRGPWRRRSSATEAADADAALGRLSATAELAALADRDIIIETIVEDKATKLETFRGLAEVVEAEDAVLASNTSSIPIVELASATKGRAAQVLGLHLLQPGSGAPARRDHPVAAHRSRHGRTRRGVRHRPARQGPDTAPDRAGFTVNALLIPYLLSAIRMLEQGMASAEDIDKGMVEGCAHPMGPLALADMIGLDTVMGIAETLHAEHREQLFAPPPLLQRLVAAGLLGRKTGRGLYSYEGGGGAR
jgi:3-hydroxybutyryl-CoA dehydrogenase